MCESLQSEFSNWYSLRLHVTVVCRFFQAGSVCELHGVHDVDPLHSPSHCTTHLHHCQVSREGEGVTGEGGGEKERERGRERRREKVEF